MDTTWSRHGEQLEPRGLRQCLQQWPVREGIQNRSAVRAVGAATLARALEQSQPKHMCATVTVFYVIHLNCKGAHRQHKTWK